MIWINASDGFNPLCHHGQILSACINVLQIATEGRHCKYLCKLTSRWCPFTKLNPLPSTSDLRSIGRGPGSWLDPTFKYDKAFSIIVCLVTARHPASARRLVEMSKSETSPKRTLLLRMVSSSHCRYSFGASSAPFSSSQEPNWSRASCRSNMTLTDLSRRILSPKNHLRLAPPELSASIMMTAQLLNKCLHQTCAAVV